MNEPRRGSSRGYVWAGIHIRRKSPAGGTQLGPDNVIGRGYPYHCDPRRIGIRAETAFDYGCGTGSSVPYFFELLQVRSMVGVDISQSCLEVAEKMHGHLPARFLRIDRFTPDGSADLAFCNGVLHHVPPQERSGVIRYIHGCLRPGGVFALWENNPYNPGTRWVMSRIPFDRDAIPLAAGEARALVREAGFEPLRTDHVFLFPRFLKLFRALEPCLAQLPLGAQYQVLCRRG